MANAQFTVEDQKMRLRNYLLLSGIACSLALLPQLALAEDTPGKIDETQTRNSRGLGFAPLNPTGSVQAPVAVPAIKKVEIKKAIEKVSTPKRNNLASAKRNNSKPVNHEPVSKTATHAANPVQIDRPSNNGRSQSVQLVSMKQEDGPVISAKLDRAGNQPKYKVGDKLVVNVKANQDCNVVVFNYDSTGTLTQIFPNDYQQNGFVKAGDSVDIGGRDSIYDYQISGKGGPEKVFVYAYPTNNEKPPITQLTAMAPIAGTPFRGGEMTVDQYRDMVNNSKVFFARSVQVMPKKSAQLVSNSAPAASPNKVELSFSVDAK